MRAASTPVNIYLISMYVLIWYFFFLGDRYCPMLESQGGDEVLYKLLKSRLTSQYMKSLIEEIFQTLRSNGYRKY